MNPDDLIINQVALDDLSRLQHIVRECIALMESQGIYQWDDIYPDEKILREDIDTHTLWAARIDGDIVGTIVLNEYQSQEYQQLSWRFGGRILVVHRLMVAPSCQHQKLATQLMQFAEEYAVAGKYNAIRLDAFIQNPAAVGLYRKLGYWEAGIVTFRKGKFYCFEKKI